jgi:outer membrane protein W
MIKYILITVLLQLAIFNNVTCQSYFFFESGMNDHFVSESDDPHEDFLFDTKPGFAMSAGYSFHDRDNMFITFDVNYFELDIKKEGSSGGLGCPDCYYENTRTVVDFISLDVYPEIHWGNKLDFYVKLGFSGSFVIKSNINGTIRTKSLVEQDTTYYFKTHEFELNNKKVDYSWTYDLVTGVGMNFPLNSRIGVKADVNFYPFIDWPRQVSLRTKVGLWWKLNSSLKKSSHKN